MEGHLENRIWTVVIKVTGQCTAKCSHCSVHSGPDRHDHLPWPIIKKTLLECPEIGCPSVWISGGEPFLRFRQLQYIVTLAKRLHIRVIINSNAYWAISREVARTVLAKLCSCGPFEIALSSDDFHLPFIGFDQVENAAFAARELNLSHWLGRVTYVGDGSRDEMRERAIKANLPVTEQPLQYIGRARQELIQLQTTDVRQEYSPCSTVMIPTVLSDGRVSMCCTGAAGENPRLIVGDLNKESLQAVVRRLQDDIVYNGLRVGGPGFLLSLASTEIQSGSRAPYLSKCQHCREVCNTPGLDEAISKRGGSTLRSTLVSLDVLQRAHLRSNTQTRGHEVPALAHAREV
jgi:Radical SAM superfamily